MTKQVIEKIFFGKNNALKVNLNQEHDVYFSLGSKDGDKWSWKKVKMNDVELGDILRVLEGDSPKASFYHEFQGEKTQIWVNKKDKYVFVRVADFTKGLSQGEQVVFREILKYAVLRMNMEL